MSQQESLSKSQQESARVSKSQQKSARVSKSQQESAIRVSKKIEK
jgi:hypothetical protein